MNGDGSNGAGYIILQFKEPNQSVGLRARDTSQNEFKFFFGWVSKPVNAGLIKFDSEMIIDVSSKLRHISELSVQKVASLSINVGKRCKNSFR